MRQTCVGRRCAAGRSFLWNRSAWSLWVVPFRLSSVGGLGYRNITAVRGTIVWEMGKCDVLVSDTFKRQCFPLASTSRMPSNTKDRRVSNDEPEETKTTRSASFIR